MAESPTPPVSDDPAHTFLTTLPFFHGVPEASLDKAISHLVTRTYPPNQIILLEKDWGGSVYFIQSGWVKIRTYNLDGKEITLNILGAGEPFGEMAALEEGTRSTDVIALTPTTISSIPAADFIDLVHTEPLVGVRLAQLMAKRLRQINRRLQVRETNSLARVADTLVFLAESQGQAAGQSGIQIPSLPHRELSSLSGLARETVTRVLTKLEKKGLIRRTPDALVIPDLRALDEIIH
ncbi:MAG: Crp/Fnr family transcriptional regulator [Synechococcus sp.]|nr:Crp/Fnr family transcriptional regulator [Synechococcus sp.]